MSDLSCVKCGRHFDAAAASCPECGELRGEAIAAWPPPLLRGAECWQRPTAQAEHLAQAVKLARTRTPEPIDHHALEELFTDGVVPHAPAEPEQTELMLLEDDDIFDVDEMHAQSPLQPEPATLRQAPIVEEAVVATPTPTAASERRVPLAERFAWSDVELDASAEPTAMGPSSSPPFSDISEKDTELGFPVDAANVALGHIASTPLFAPEGQPATSATEAFASEAVFATSDASLSEASAPSASVASAAVAGEIAHAQLAPLWQRALAAIVDLLPIAGVTALTLIALEPVLERAHVPLLPRSVDELARFWWALGPKMIFVAVAIFGTALLYHTLSFVLMQGTVGDLIFGIVWITKKGRRPGLFRALWRGLCLVVSVALFGGGLWFALLTRSKRTFYDVMSGLYPVKRKSLVIAPAALVADLPLAA